MVPPSKSISSVAPLDALTGLRFVAAFLVFFYHAQYQFPITSFKLGSLGGNAVAFFFVLSGFILTYVYHERLTVQRIGKFYLTRWARIWPLHIFCLLVFVVAFRLHSPFAQSSKESWKFFTHIFLLQSWIPDPDWPLSFNGVAWTISTEMGFYLAFPFLLLAGRRRFWPIYLILGLLTATGVAIANAIWQAHPDQFRSLNGTLHFSPPFRIFEFATGMVVGRLYLSGAHKSLAQKTLGLQTGIEVVAIVATLGCFVFFGPSGGFRKLVGPADNPLIVAYLSRGTGFILVFAAVVWVFSWSRGLVAKLLSRRWFVFLGEISFAFYLIHQLVQVQVNSFAYGVPLSTATLFTASLGITLALSALLYALVEVPCKAAILATADRNWSKAIHAVISAPIIGWRERVLPGALALGIASGSFLYWQISATSALGPSDPAIMKVLAETKAELKDVFFEGEARLHGVVCERVPDGLKIKMVWQSLPNGQRTRFVHICNSEGIVLRQGKPEGSAFRRFGPHQLWIDEVFIDEESLEGAAYIGIGFFSPQLKAARVLSGPRSMGKHRLNIFDVLREGLQTAGQSQGR